MIINILCTLLSINAKTIEFTILEQDNEKNDEPCCDFALLFSFMKNLFIYKDKFVSEVPDNVLMKPNFGICGRCNLNMKKTASILFNQYYVSATKIKLKNPAAKIIMCDIDSIDNSIFLSKANKTLSEPSLNTINNYDLVEGDIYLLSTRVSVFWSFVIDTKDVFNLKEDKDLDHVILVPAAIKKKNTSVFLPGYILRVESIFPEEHIVFMETESFVGFFSLPALLKYNMFYGYKINDDGKKLISTVINSTVESVEICSEESINNSIRALIPIKRYLRKYDAKKSEFEETSFLLPGHYFAYLALYCLLLSIFCVLSYRTGPQKTVSDEELD
ncbi:hypothetical protein NUSPORA_00932 [Nucleospora cyclopteri]